MSKARLVITAVVIEKRPVAEVAAAYGVSRSWIYELLARYRIEGEQAFEPRSRRPNRVANATPTATVELIIGLRRELTTVGLDAGADTIAWHLEYRHHITVSRPTVHRILQRHALITPEPTKRPRSSYIRFQAEQPNETWQADFTHYRLADGTDVEILSWIDDHSRYALSVTAHSRVTGPIVVATFRTAVATHGVPYSTLTDNGMVFTTRHAGGKGGRNALEAELVRLGVRQKNSRPNHPTTCGKVERFQQTLKNWLRRQPPPATITELQTLCDTFTTIYNHQRPHRSLTANTTPHLAYITRPKAAPTGTNDPHWRVRHDRINSGRVTLRVNGQLHYIALSRTLEGTRVILLVHDLHIRVVDAATGELLRDLTINPQHRYHGTGQPPGGPKGPRKPQQSEPQ